MAVCSEWRAERCASRVRHRTEDLASDSKSCQASKGKWCHCAFKVLAQQLVEGMCGAVPVEHFPGPVVEHRLHPLDLASRELIKPRARGKKLAQQAIGVLVRPPLPGTLRVGKIDAHLRLLGEEAVLPHFLTLVVHERAPELGGQRARS